jgi:hypothetical protein
MESTQPSTSAQRHAGTEPTDYEQGTAFWTTPGTQVIGSTILVKRFDDGNEDNIHIMRINKQNLSSKFRFPSVFIPTLVERTRALLEQLEFTDDKIWKLPGVDKVTSWEELNTDEFWAGDDYIKVSKLRIKPYVGNYKTIQFRLWNEIDNYQTYENPDGSTRLWRGPAVSLSVTVMKKLVAVLEKLNTAQPETKNGLSFLNSLLNN